VDGDPSIDLEAEAHRPVADVEYRDLEQVLEAVGPPDDHRLLG
jgi:hypothetical protein